MDYQLKARYKVLYPSTQRGNYEWLGETLGRDISTHGAGTDLAEIINYLPILAKFRIKFLFGPLKEGCS
jgi:hypothetical protein